MQEGSTRREFLKTAAAASSSGLALLVAACTSGAVPTVSLHSPANLASGPIRQTVNDKILDVVAGRAAMTDFESTVSDWRAKVGDKIRAEFEQAIQSAS